jgi:hypothetical protein
MFVQVPVSTRSVLYDRFEPSQPVILEEGTHFMASAALPDKWKVINVPVHLQNMQIKFKEPLPLSRYLQLPDSFELQLDLTVYYNIEKNQLPTLLSRVNYDPTRIQKVFNAGMVRAIRKFFLENFQTPSDLNTLQGKLEAFFDPEKKDEGLLQISSEFLRINNKAVFSISDYQVNSLYVPEYVAYQQVIDNSSQYFQAIRQATLDKIAVDATEYQQDLKNQQQLKKLRQLSNLLKANPTMADIIKIEILSSKARVFYYMDREAGRSKSGQSSAQSNNSTGPVLDIPEIVVSEEGQIMELNR